MSKTKKDYEKYLNELYCDSYSEGQAIDNLKYLGDETVIRRNHTNHTLGTLLRRKDNIQFEVGYAEWNKSK
jgi:hypothetical protein